MYHIDGDSNFGQTGTTWKMDLRNVPDVPSDIRNVTVDTSKMTTEEIENLRKFLTCGILWGLVSWGGIDPESVSRKVNGILQDIRGEIIP